MRDKKRLRNNFRLKKTLMMSKGTVSSHIEYWGRKNKKDMNRKINGI